MKIFVKNGYPWVRRDENDVRIKNKLELLVGKSIY